MLLLWCCCSWDTSDVFPDSKLGKLRFVLLSPVMSNAALPDVTYIYKRITSWIRWASLQRWVSDALLFCPLQAPLGCFRSRASCDVVIPQFGGLSGGLVLRSKTRSGVCQFLFLFCNLTGILDVVPASDFLSDSTCSVQARRVEQRCYWKTLRLTWWNYEHCRALRVELAGYTPKRRQLRTPGGVWTWCLWYFLGFSWKRRRVTVVIDTITEKEPVHAQVTSQCRV